MTDSRRPSLRSNNSSGRHRWSVVVGDDESTVATEQISHKSPRSQWGKSNTGGSENFSEVSDGEEHTTPGIMSPNPRGGRFSAPFGGRVPRGSGHPRGVRRRRFSLLWEDDADPEKPCWLLAGWVPYICCVTSLFAVCGVGAWVGVLFSSEGRGESEGGNQGPLSVAGSGAIVDLGEICSAGSVATKGGRAACVDECAMAFCCHTAEDCPQDFITFCDAYAPCSVVWNYSRDSNVPPAPLNLKAICAVDAVSTEEGFTQCELACLKATCCWSRKKTMNCYNEQKSVCDTYGACHFVNQGSISGTVTDFEGTNLELPVSSGFDTLFEGKDEPHDVFMNDDLVNTDDVNDEDKATTLGTVTAQTSVQSENVQVGFFDQWSNETTFPPPTKSNVNATANETRPEARPTTVVVAPVDNEGLGGDNENGTAAFDENTNSTVTGNVTVQDKSLLAKDEGELRTGMTTKMERMIDGDFFARGKQMDSNGNIVGIDHSTGTTVEELCVASSIQTSEGLRKCQTACSERPCCYSLEDELRCDHDLVHYCREHSACLKASAEFPIEGALLIVDNLADLCSEGKLRSGLRAWRNCVYACEAKECCVYGTCSIIGFCANYDVCVTTFQSQEARQSATFDPYGT